MVYVLDSSLQGLICRILLGESNPFEALVHLFVKRLSINTKSSFMFLGDLGIRFTYMERILV